MVAATKHLYHVMGHHLQSADTCVTDQLGVVQMVLQNTVAV